MKFRLLQSINPYACFVEDAGAGDQGGGSEKPLTLSQVVEKAALEIKGVSSEEPKTPAKESSEKEEKDDKGAKTEEEKGGEEEDEDDEDDDISDEDKQNAIRLFRALKDPKAGPIVLEAMAKEGGYTKGGTKEEQDKAVDAIEAILHKHIGEDFPTLSKILGPAIREAVREAAKEANKDIEQEIISQKAERQRVAVETAQTKVFDSYEGNLSENESLLKEISKTMDVVKPAKGSTMESYFRTVLLTAADNCGIELKKVQQSSKKESTSEVQDKRRERNRQDIKSQIESKDKTTIGRASSDGTSGDKKPVSIKEAVEAAAATLSGRQK